MCGLRHQFIYIYTRAVCVSVCMLVALLLCVIFCIQASRLADEATSRSVATGDPLIVLGFLAGYAFTALLVHGSFTLKSKHLISYIQCYGGWWSL